MKKILLSALVLVMTLSFNACSEADLPQDINAQEEFSESLDEQAVIEADASPQWEANEKLARLMKSFGTTSNSKNEALNFPDYYGGAYITEQGKLVVYIHRDDLEKQKEKITSLVGSGNVELKKADYSYAYLTDIMDQLNEFVINKKNPSVMANFNVFALMDKENRIVVELKDYNEEKIAVFKKLVLNSPAIKFVKSQGEMVLEVDLQPGCKASLNTSGTSYGSYGFAARRNSDGRRGMVTAGHVISVGETLYQGGTAIGVCSASQISGSVDAAFVPITNPTSYVPSNVLCNTASDILSVSTSLPGVGTVVNKRGATTGQTSGTILSTNATWTSPTSGNTLTNITTANYTSSGGDSGGIVYTYISSTGTRPTVGTHIGAIGSTRYYSKASLVLSALGLSRY